MDQVSEDQGLPIAHVSDIALTTAFVLGGNRCWPGACRGREAGGHAEPAGHVLAEELLDKARPIAEKFSDPCRVPQLKGQFRVRGAGIFELPDQLGPVRGRGDSDDETFRAQRPGPSANLAMARVRSDSLNS